MGPLLQHPSRFVWDFWYYYEREEGLFHVFFLNADPVLVPKQRHHFHAEVGYAVTEDFLEIQWIDHSVFSATSDGWDNTSIWTGDVVPVSGGYAFFYTSRDRRQDDGMTQNIGMAFSADFRRWERVPEVRIEPDTRWYEPRTVTGEKTIHAWRDPYPFRWDGESYLLVTAKDSRSPAGRKGCIALLRANGESLVDWEALPPLWSPGLHDEMEVSQIYRTDEDRYLPVYSTGPEPRTMGVELRAEEGLEGAVQISDPYVLVPPETGLYACRLIPELGGEMVGFDTERGGLRRSGFRHDGSLLDRDFRSPNRT